MPFQHSANGEFTHTAVWTGTRLLIQSACNRCGASKVVSVHDGSLGQWENTHRCQQAA